MLNRTSHHHLINAIYGCAILCLISGCHSSTSHQLQSGIKIENQPLHRTAPAAIQIDLARGVSGPPRPQDFYSGRPTIKWLGDVEVSRPYDESQIREFASELGASNVTIFVPKFEPDSLPWQVRDTTVRFDDRTPPVK